MGLHDTEDLVEDLAAFYLVKTGLHPVGVVSVVLSAQMALVDVVNCVKEGLILGNGDVDYLADDILNIGDDPCVHPRDDAVVNDNEFFQEVSEEGPCDCGEHILGEAEGASVFGEVVDGALIAGHGVGKGDGADVVFGRDVHDHAALGLTQLNKADGRGVSKAGAGLDIIHGIAAFGGELGDILRVHMSGEHHFHARVCKLGRDAIIVLNKVHGENVGLHGEVGDKAVVRKADDAVAACLCRGYLLYRPRLELGAHLAPGLMLGLALGVVVGAVAAGVHSDESNAVRDLRGIGELTGLLALGGRKARDDAVVGIYKVVYLGKI